jgi:hypothetical protein
MAVPSPTLYKFSFTGSIAWWMVALLVNAPKLRRAYPIMLA